VRAVHVGFLLVLVFVLHPPLRQRAPYRWQVSAFDALVADNCRGDDAAVLCFRLMQVR